MTKFESKLNRVINLNNQVNEITEVLCEIVSAHLGGDWYVTYNRGDGWLLGSPDACNYQIGTYLQTQRMTREAAIAYIEARPFN